ncbi:hypothetical protein CHELA40_10794 [Chelatococcus asaccharovorans]|nr:hypothetical protein CHELA40_10794 [Chelatococcus asaccharovorans]CAH1686043.1 hypothetical protein CHELA17_64809 [Chelatococcus asaccharovorans]
MSLLVPKVNTTYKERESSRSGTTH